MSGSKGTRKRLGAQESINKHLDKLGYSGSKRQGKWVECRAPSCKKPVLREFTHNGYCLACVEKARKLKAEREHMARIERDAMKCYDDDNFGLF